jgi:hypothetical protein
MSSFERPSSYDGCTLKPVIGVAVFWQLDDRKWPNAEVGRNAPKLTLQDTSATDRQLQFGPTLCSTRRFRGPSSYFKSSFHVAVGLRPRNPASLDQRSFLNRWS